MWLGDASGLYSVRSAYVGLTENVATTSRFSDDHVAVLGRQWKSLATPKVIAFSWRLLLD